MKTSTIIKNDLKDILKNLPEDVTRKGCGISDGAYQISGGNKAMLSHMKGSNAENCPQFFMYDAYIKTRIADTSIRLSCIGLGIDNGVLTYQVLVKKHGKGTNLTNEYALGRKDAINKFSSMVKLVISLNE